MDRIIVNPFLEFRRNENKSISQIAKILGVSESTYIRTEQGLYNDIPPVLLRNFSRHTLSPELVRNQYARSQVSQRIATFKSGRIRQEYYKDLKEFIKVAPFTSPFLIWRIYVQDFGSRLEFCKAVCVHPSTVKRVEDGVSESIPEAIMTALEQSAVDLHPLNKEYVTWRKNPTRS